MSKNIINKINDLQKEIQPLVQTRLNEFKNNINKNDNELFVELCFCIIVANNSIENALRAYNSIGLDFLKLNEQELKEKLKVTARRFYNKRAEYIIEARKNHQKLINKIRELESSDKQENKKQKTKNKNIEIEIELEIG